MFKWRRVLKNIPGPDVNPGRGLSQSASIILNREGFFASLRMTTESLFPQPVQLRHQNAEKIGL
jgi:hypothetical protein